MTSVLLVALGGGLGAGLRWLAIVAIPSPPGGFPAAITAVNVIGSMALGVVAGAQVDALAGIDVDTVTIGVLGGFTTFSTWMVDIERVDRIRMSAAITVVPLCLGLMAAALGVALGAAAS
jgi:CrcB protein